MRRLTLMVATTILAGIVGVLGWAGVTHQVAYVVTNGVSMQPLYHAGDLVVVAKKDSYRTGDIIAYPYKGITVLHRIIKGNANGFTTKGDNNESIDLGRPTSSDILGRAVLHITQGGTWLKRVYSGPVLAAAAFFTLIGTGETVRRRRRRRRTTVGKPVGHTSPAGVLALLSTPRLRTLAGVVAATGLFAVLLGLLVGAKPAMETLTVQPPVARSMTFSYGTTVPKTSAYDSTKVTAPDPVFRSVADKVDVTYTYSGTPGQVEVNAELSLPNGWHSTVPLADSAPTDGTGTPSVVHLDLDALAARAAAGAKASSGMNVAGAQIPAVKIAVVPQVTTDSGKPFTPALDLQLTPQSLALLTPDSPLKIDDVAPAPIKVPVPQGMSFAGHELISVIGARILSAILLLGAALGAAVLMFFIRRAGPVPEDELIRRQYSAMLVEVHPMEAPTDRPVVEVTEFKTLERLAKRYGLLILHWTTEGSTTFTLQDDSTAYQYHTGPAPADDTATDEPEEPAHWQLTMSEATDELTELPDGSLFEQEMQYVIDAGGGPGLCLMLIDVDNLDSINDEQGRGAGDSVLVGIAERLRRAVRPRDLVARLDGDDFAVLLEDVSRTAVDSVAKRVLRVANESMLVNGHLLQVQVTLGVVQADADQNAALLMEQATAALAEAKATSDSHCAWFAEIAMPDLT